MYRIRGSLGRYKSEALRLLGRGSPDEQNLRPGLLKMANPFIAQELGRRDLRPAPIPTSLRETYAQCNEDIIVESLLRARFRGTGRQLSSVRYLEIGGNHPVQTSSTYLFYRGWGAKGWLVEADPSLAARLRAVRARDQVIDVAVSDKEDPTLSFFVHERNELSSLSKENIAEFSRWGGTEKIAREMKVPNLHVNKLFDRYIDEPLDFMSIDIEGLDAAVLRALRPEIKPTVLQAEWTGDDATLDEFLAILRPRGYALAGLTDVNAIFVAD
jgi:FkbM family methyltransferase